MELTFEFGNEVIIVRIKGHNVLFSTSQTNFQNFYPIEGLKLSKDGILKEHPDLKNLSDDEIRKEGIRRFKKKIVDLGGENEIKDYIVNELSSIGYSLLKRRDPD